MHKDWWWFWTLRPEAGHGEPRLREPGLVATDLRDEMVTLTEATKFYGYE